jgi:hypothetical protein
MTIAGCGHWVVVGELILGFFKPVANSCTPWGTEGAAGTASPDGRAASTQMQEVMTCGHVHSDCGNTAAMFRNELVMLFMFWGPPGTPADERAMIGKAVQTLPAVIDATFFVMVVLLKRIQAPAAYKVPMVNAESHRDTVVSELILITTDV